MSTLDDDKPPGERPADGQEDTMPRVPRHPVLLGLVLAAWVALIVTAAWLTRT